MRNPVIFVTEVVSVLVTVLGIRNLIIGQPAAFALAIAAWLWLTVLFATFAEAMAEGRGRARAESLRKARTDTMAKLLLNPADRVLFEPVAAPDLRSGDIVLVEAGDLIPSDGEVIEGVASVNESAITGESAPVIREAGGDRSAVTGGTQVVSDWLVVRITAEAGEHLHRPHDPAGRRRRAAQDSERNRAGHSAGRADDHIPCGSGYLGRFRPILRGPILASRYWLRCWSA